MTTFVCNHNSSFNILFFVEVVMKFSRTHLWGHWTLCINLRYISKKGFFWNITGSKWDGVTLVVSISLLSYLMVILTSYDFIIPWTSYPLWVGNVVRNLSLLIFTSHTLLLVVWFSGWSYGQSCKHFNSQCPLNLYWWKKYLFLLQVLFDILLSMCLWVCRWIGEVFLTFLLWNKHILCHMVLFSQQDATWWYFFPHNEHTFYYQ